jgi:hypothetical protein
MGILLVNKFLPSRNIVEAKTRTYYPCRLKSTASRQDLTVSNKLWSISFFEFEHYSLAAQSSLNKTTAFPAQFSISNEISTVLYELEL